MEAPATDVQTGFFYRFTNLIFAPGKAFESIAHKPGWATPWLVAFIVSALCLVALKDVYVAQKVKLTREALAKETTMAETQKEQALEWVAKLWFVDLIFILIWFLIAILLGGLILKLVGNKLLGGNLDFSTGASLYAYAQLVDIPAWIVKGPLIYLNESLRVDTGLGLLVPDASILSAQYYFLSSFDVFTLWKLALVVMGMSVVTKSPVSRSAIVVGSLWLAWVLVRSGLASVNVHLP